MEHRSQRFLLHPMARMAFGVAQMVGATVGIGLVALSGLTRQAIAVALLTTLMTGVSLLIFGGRSR